MPPPPRCFCVSCRLPRPNTRAISTQRERQRAAECETRCAKANTENATPSATHPNENNHRPHIKHTTHATAWWHRNSTRYTLATIQLQRELTIYPRGTHVRFRNSPNRPQPTKPPALRVQFRRAGKVRSRIQRCGVLSIL